MAGSAPGEPVAWRARSSAPATLPTYISNVTLVLLCAFQAATREHAAETIGLAEAAADVAVGMPATVRASVSTRLAYG